MEKFVFGCFFGIMATLILLINIIPEEAMPGTLRGKLNIC